MLTNAEMTTIIGLLLAKSGDALQAAVDDYREAVLRGEKPMFGKATGKKPNPEMIGSIQTGGPHRNTLRQ